MPSLPGQGDTVAALGQPRDVSNDLASRSIYYWDAALPAPQIVVEIPTAAFETI
jgi:hypothetical protein